MELPFSRADFKANHGKICKGSVVDAYNRLTQPSIRGKSEQLLEPLHKIEGFGSSASRFIETYKKNPGPGHYSQKDLGNPSVSKKGFGGLINIAPRFKRSQYINLVPGPGTYYKTTTEAIPGFVIAPPKTISLKKSEKSPAPGQYDPLIQNSVNAMTSVFKSKSEKLKQENKNYPAPWQYNPNYSLTKSGSSILTSAFKMPVSGNDKNSKPEFMIIEKKGSPGPGDYNPYLVNDDGRPSSMFALSVKDRFGHGGKGKEASPGPGSYDKIRKIDKTPASGAVFRSETERILTTSKKKNPGPAFYKPILQPKKKSFHYKLNNIWI